MKKLYIFITLLTFANTSHAVSRFDPILKEIIKFQEFEIEAQEKLEKAQNKNETIKTQIDNIDNDEILEKFSKKYNTYQDEQINKFFELITKLQHNEISGSDFLEQLLKDRLHGLIYLRSRTLISQTYFLNMPPLDEKLFKLWARDDSNESMQYNMLVKKNNITRYQLTVILIKKIFQLLNIEELSPQTLKLLRASPFIWPILQNQTNDLGHHDQSGGYIKIKTYMDYFKCSLITAIAKIKNNEPCPKWEKNKQNYDVYLYEANFIPKEKFIESKMLGAPKNSGVTIELTDYEAGECDDLPYPDFLKVQPERPFIESERFFDTFNFNTFNDEINEFEKAPVLSTEANLSSENIINIIDINNIINFSELTPSESVSNDTIENNITSDSDNDYFLPSGIRKFHNLMPEAPYPPRSLKKKQQKFVDRIFNSKTSHTISYGEFKKFWNKMNGQIIEDTGSSHKHLIGPKGDSLYGVAAHNDAHTYGKNTIKYFRAALYYIGCRPS
jgi:hypothetical protein